MDSILEDSVDSLNDNLDYSSPPLWDDYDDNLFDHETVNDDTYDDPFDFKEEKIKEFAASFRLTTDVAAF
ncbi:hypothetical protein Tco_0141945 [Tanacetum coccineum]